MEDAQIVMTLARLVHQAIHARLAQLICSTTQQILMSQFPSAHLTLIQAMIQVVLTQRKEERIVNAEMASLSLKKAVWIVFKTVRGV
jgi:hypothetical protein